MQRVKLIIVLFLSYFSLSFSAVVQEHIESTCPTDPTFGGKCSLVNIKTDGRSCKTINGVKVCRDWWKKTYTYQCSGQDNSALLNTFLNQSYCRLITTCKQWEDVSLNGGNVSCRVYLDKRRPGCGKNPNKPECVADDCGDIKKKCSLKEFINYGDLPDKANADTSGIALGTYVYQCPSSVRKVCRQYETKVKCPATCPDGSKVNCPDYSNQTVCPNGTFVQCPEQACNTVKTCKQYKTTQTKGTQIKSCIAQRNYTEYKVLAGSQQAKNLANNPSCIKIKDEVIPPVCNGTTKNINGKDICVLAEIPRQSLEGYSIRKVIRRNIKIPKGASLFLHVLTYYSCDDDKTYFDFVLQDSKTKKILSSVNRQCNVNEDIPIYNATNDITVDIKLKAAHCIGTNCGNGLYLANCPNLSAVNTNTNNFNICYDQNYELDMINDPWNWGIAQQGGFHTKSNSHLNPCGNNPYCILSVKPCSSCLGYFGNTNKIYPLEKSLSTNLGGNTWDGHESYIGYEMKHYETYRCYANTVNTNYCSSLSSNCQLLDNLNDLSNLACNKMFQDVDNPNKKVCAEYSIQYQCPTTITKRECQKWETRQVCNGTVFPIKDVEIENKDFSKDFAKATALAQLSNELKHIWSGKWRKCENGWWSDVFDNPTEFFKQRLIGFAIAQLGSQFLSAATTFVSDYLGQCMALPLTATTSGSYASYQDFQQAQQTMGKCLSNGASQAWKDAGNNSNMQTFLTKIGLDPNSPAVSFLASPMGQFALQTAVAIIMTTQKCDACSSKKCAEKHGQYDTYGLLKGGNCIFVQDGCAWKIKWPGGSVCLRKKYHYCCYDSTFAKTLVKQAYKQLGYSFAGGNCSALTFDDIKRLDFSQMDWSELQNYLESKMEGQIDPNLIKKKINNYFDSSYGNQNFTGETPYKK